MFMRTRAISALTLFLAVLAAKPEAAADAGAEVDGLVRQWTALEQQRSRLQSEWRVRRQYLEQRLELLALEERTLGEFLAEHRSSTDEVESRRFELLEQQTAYEAQQEALAAWLDGVLVVLKRVRPRLPPPLAAEWRNALQLADSGGDASGSERLNHILSMLRAADEFQRVIPVHAATMTLADGAVMRVDQAYLGLSQGWYVSADGRHAGYGRPGPDGWEWTDRAGIDGLDPRAVRRLVDMVREPATAELLELPVRLGAPD